MTRPEQIEQLDLLQNQIEKDICNYALDEWEDLYEEKVICRRLVFGRGNTLHEVIVNPAGQIRDMDADTPIHLIQQLGNVSISHLYAQIR
tara:strand:+ start:4711 stop:4980 length:270 start_codon:yes stop_codon:yes gene_type:complete